MYIITLIHIYIVNNSDGIYITSVDQSVIIHNNESSLSVISSAKQEDVRWYYLHKIVPNGQSSPECQSFEMHVICKDQDQNTAAELASFSWRSRVCFGCWDYVTTPWPRQTEQPSQENWRS